MVQHPSVKYGYVYETRNLVNGKLYVGVRTGDKVVKAYLGGGMALQRAIKKYGRSAFQQTVIRWEESREALSNAEVETIAAYRDMFGLENVYNISQGWFREMGGNRGWKQSPEWKAKKRALMTGRVLSAETRAKQSAALKGHAVTEETRMKIGAANAGKKRPPLSAERKAVLRTANLGKVFSAETKERIRQAKEFWREARVMKSRMLEEKAWESVVVLPRIHLQ